MGHFNITPSPPHSPHPLTPSQLILAATEQFNKKPSRGVSFLSEQGVFRSPLEPLEVASWLHDNPGLNKAMIGEYVGDRRNSEVLHAFVR